jgi:hypothetical protein
MIDRDLRKKVEAVRAMFKILDLPLFRLSLVIGM